MWQFIARWKGQPGLSVTLPQVGSIAPNLRRAVWADIVAATEAGRLGWKAKVATDHRPDKDVLICVYTKNWRDHPDVAPGAGGAARHGHHPAASYKEDAATLVLRYSTDAAPVRLSEEVL